MFKQIRHRATAYIVLVISILFTLTVAQYITQRAAEQANVNFEQIANVQRTKIAERLENRVTLLRSATGLFATRGRVTAEEFRAYVARLDLGRFYPDVRALAYGVRTNRGTNDAYPIVYLEPANGPNERNFGLDIFADPQVRPVFEQARDSASPAISEKWNRHDDESLFLICLPVYKEGGSPE